MFSIILGDGCEDFDSCTAVCRYEKYSPQRQVLATQDWVKKVDWQGDNESIYPHVRDLSLAHHTHRSIVLHSLVHTVTRNWQFSVSSNDIQLGFCWWRLWTIFESFTLGLKPGHLGPSVQQANVLTTRSPIYLSSYGTPIHVSANM